MLLADRVNRIKPSPTLAVAARAIQMQAAGHDIINLSVGEPDFDTPDHIKEAAIKAIHDGFTKYTAVAGTLELRQAITAKLEKDNQLNYDPSQILVSCGCKQSFFNLAQALLNAGDEVIIPAPYWVSYPDMVLLADATPVILHAGIEQQFKIIPQQLKAAITPKTRLVVLNSPSNPTGITYSKAELQALAEVLLPHPEIYIATDDIYEAILWGDEPFTNILNVCSDLRERTIVLNGVSKSYAMTGWRIGYAAAPKTLITAMTNIQSQSTSNPCSISQAAALAALSGPQDCIQQMTQAFKQRHDFVYEKLSVMPGVQCLPAQGAFYSFPSLQAVIDRSADMSDDIALAEIILAKAGLAVIPGSAFGAPGCLRLSFATSMDKLSEAMNRLDKLVNELI
jgi:aspartate aminotransferase